MGKVKQFDAGGNRDKRREELLTMKEAYDLCKPLRHAMPYFGSDDTATAFVAKEMRCLCREQWVSGDLWSAPQLGEWLVTAMVRAWNDWQGIGAMRSLFCDRFMAGDDPLFEQRNALLKPADLAPDEKFPLSPPEPAPQACDACSFWGMVKVSDAAYDWCSCEYGQYLSKSTPDMLRLANETLKKSIVFQRMPPLRPLRKEVKRILRKS